MVCVVGNCGVSVVRLPELGGVFVFHDDDFLCGGVFSGEKSEEVFLGGGGESKPGSSDVC